MYGAEIANHMPLAKFIGDFNFLSEIIGPQDQPTPSLSLNREQLKGNLYNNAVVTRQCFNYSLHSVFLCNESTFHLIIYDSEWWFARQMLKDNRLTVYGMQVNVSEMSQHIKDGIFSVSFCLHQPWQENATRYN